MRQRWLLSLNRSGDTIVEVLLAIAIVSAVLGGAFVSASHSLRGTQLSQERGEALKHVEGQVESLKSALKDPVKGPQIFGLPGGVAGIFCLDDTLDIVMIPAAGDPRCRRGRYSLNIFPSGAIYGNGKQFLVSAVWERLSGGAETLTIEYRAYQ